MVAGDRFMKVPPHSLYRIYLRCMRRQEVNLDAVTPASQIGLHSPALVERGVIADDVDFGVTPQALAQIVQVLEEQLRVGTLRWLADEQRPSPPVQCTGHVSLLMA